MREHEILTASDFPWTNNVVMSIQRLIKQERCSNFAVLSGADLLERRLIVETIVGPDMVRTVSVENFTAADLKKLIFGRDHSSHTDSRLMELGVNSEISGGLLMLEDGDKMTEGAQHWLRGLMDHHENPEINYYGYEELQLNIKIFLSFDRGGKANLVDRLRYRIPFYYCLEPLVVRRNELVPLLKTVIDIFITPFASEINFEPLLLSLAEFKFIPLSLLDWLSFIMRCRDLLPNQTVNLEIFQGITGINLHDLALAYTKAVKKNKLERRSFLIEKISLSERREQLERFVGGYWFCLLEEFEEIGTLNDPNICLKLLQLS